MPAGREPPAPAKLPAPAAALAAVPAANRPPPAPQAPAGPPVRAPIPPPVVAPIPPPVPAPAALAARAGRLLRWYPQAWRARYGAEFTELLVADLAERPRCWRRGLDVARCGLLARLAGAGLVSHPAGPRAAAGAALATLACSAGGFLTLGATMWAQLTVGWQWAAPADRPTTVAMLVMSAAMLVLAALAAAAAAPLAWAVARAARQGGGRPRRPALLLITGSAAVLVLGGRHFGNGWPGTGAHWWPHQGLVPAGVAAFAWACTLAVTSYWGHPAALAAFPPAELAWLAVSPLAVAGLLAGIRRLLRGLDLPPGLIRYQAWLAGAAAAVMAAFLAGALCWVTEGRPGPGGLFRPGTIDVLALGFMSAALVTGWLALRQVRRAGQGGPAARTCR